MNNTLELERFLKDNQRIWRSSLELKQKYGANALNELYLAGRIEVREGINHKVVKYIWNLPK